MRNVQVPYYYRWNSGAAFIQDDWKIRPGLTLNIGLRYSIQMPRTEKYNNQGVFRPDLAQQVALATLGSISATRLSGLLARHDDLVVQAAARGRAARYDDAVTLLNQADATIAQARTLRDQLANTVDVTVLDQWLDRNADYDVALRNLYKALAKVGSRVTDAVRKAIAAERAAKDRLPPDTRGLVVIMAEIGRGGMNGAVISIEETRAKLIDAIAASGPASAEPGSSAVPAASAAP